MNDIKQAIKYFKNLKDRNFVTLNDFKKEIEMKKTIGNNNVNYSTMVYENRDKYYDLAISALEKQLSEKPYYLNYGGVGVGNWNHGLACICDCEASYCKTCGKKLDWSEER